MATSRIESGHPHPVPDRLPPQTGPETPRALKQIKRAGKTAVAVADPEPVGSFDTDAPTENVGQRTGVSPQQCITDFSEPLISDPAIFQGSRPLSILEHLASDIIPTLGGNEEIRSLAGILIEEEIERHRQLAMQIHGGIAS
jgi:hypothetical protein